ncbi:MAG: ATP-binding protein [Candidatus Sumerlaeaceae bacterium]|nr:ATP-binding protein [Candidatus Sumerlaeaceae bacterium]
MAPGTRSGDSPPPWWRRHTLGDTPLSFHRGLPLFATMILLIAILFLFNLSTLRLLRLFEASKENDLTRQLVAVGRTVVYDLRKPTLPAIVELIAGANEENAADLLDDFADTVAYQRLAQQLSELQRANYLASLTLITTHGLVMADAARQTEPGLPFPYRELDRGAVRRAVQGQISSVPLYPIGDTYYKRVYLPIVSDGRVAAILALSASADYFESLRDIQRRVRAQMLLTSLLFAALVYLLYRFLTYLLNAEARALQLARYEAMAALAGGLAHELRNPLSIMRILCEEILSQQPSNSPTAKNAQDLIGEIERLNDLVTHFLSLSKPPTSGSAQAISLTEEVQRAAELVRKGTPSGVSVRLELANNPLQVVADPRALRQVVINLLLNARDAVAERGGEILITLAERRGMAELHVRDTGIGIPRSILSRIFEPFFTTKPSGSGLGLAVTRSIVENLGGRITIVSQEGKGTDVCVRLPLAPRTLRVSK